MKKVFTAAVVATLVSAGAMVYAAGTPVQNRQTGDLKVDLNYGFNQKMGHRDARSHFSGGDVTYVLNDKVDVQYDNNNTKASSNGDRVNEHGLRAIYHLTRMFPRSAALQRSIRNSQAIANTIGAVRWALKAGCPLPIK